eukprot:2311590-Amphidinium_carterae.1
MPHEAELVLQKPSRKCHDSNVSWCSHVHSDTNKVTVASGGFLHAIMLTFQISPERVVAKWPVVWIFNHLCSSTLLTKTGSTSAVSSSLYGYMLTLAQ